MPDSFNPYQRWLKIPAEELPPDHYVLLGIERFTQDKTKIENAAAKRMELLKKYQTGEHMEESQQLLNEVAQARACLLDSFQQASYDHELREQIKRLALPPLPNSDELVPKRDMPMRAPDHIRHAIPPDPDSLLRPTTPTRRARFRIPIWWFFVALGLVAIAWLLIAMLNV